MGAVSVLMGWSSFKRVTERHNQRASRPGSIGQKIPPIPNFTQDDFSDYEVQCGGRDTETRAWVEGTCYSGAFQGRNSETRAWIEGDCDS